MDRSSSSRIALITSSSSARAQERLTRKQQMSGSQIRRVIFPMAPDNFEGDCRLRKVQARKGPFPATSPSFALRSETLALRGKKQTQAPTRTQRRTNH